MVERKAVAGILDLLDAQARVEVEQLESQVEGDDGAAIADDEQMPLVTQMPPVQRVIGRG